MPGATFAAYRCQECSNIQTVIDGGCISCGQTDDDAWDDVTAREGTDPTEDQYVEVNVSP